MKKLEDDRVNPTYGTARVITPVFIGFLLRIRSFNSLNLMIKADEFKFLFPKGQKMPGIDTIRDTMKLINLDGFREMLKHIVKKAIKNKVFAEGTIDYYKVMGIDGTNLIGSNKKSCSECLTTKTRNNKTHFYHSGVVISTVGNGPKIVIDFEMYKPGIDASSKDEGELEVGKRVLVRALNNHPSLIDIVVYDALACNAGWFNCCIEQNIDTVVRVKKNNNSSIRRAKSQVNKMEPSAIWLNEKGFSEVKVYECAFAMDNVERPLRFVKKFAFKHSNGQRSQIMIATTGLDIGLSTLLKIIRARWDIENSVFRNMKTECNLEHCYVHGGNAVEAVICLQFIAYNLLQLFHSRRIRKHVATQHELVRLLLKGLYLLKRKEAFIFDTG